MDSNRKTAIFVGAFFLVGYAILWPGGFLIDSILDASDYLINVSANKTQVLIGMLLELINAAAVVGIAVLMFPFLKQHNEKMALGYVGSRIVESTILVVGSIFLLLLITLSQEYVKAGAPDASYFQTLGTLFIAERHLTFQFVPLVVTVGAAMFYYLLYQLKLIPRWLSVWGLIGVPFSLAAFLLAMFGRRAGASIPPSTFLNLPIGLNEIFLGIWLIVKGFNPSAIASGSAKTDN